jgi:hypothetical protein
MLCFIEIFDESKETVAILKRLVRPLVNLLISYALYEFKNRSTNKEA